MQGKAIFSPNATVVLKKRYLKKNSKGEVIETPEELLNRVAESISSVERRWGVEKEKVKQIKSEFFSMMAQLEFMPNSPTLMNAGKDLGQLSACFVIPVEDSMESIFDAIKATALVHKTGGGTGFSFSRLRSHKSIVNSTGGVASGPVSFMKVFDAATQAVKQGGTRRGANMGILRVDHPDILDFVKCKEKEGDISNFNISIAITDKFMESVLKEEDYDLIDPHTKEIKGKLNAKEVFDLIANYAHRNGEPGIVFIDKINKDNPTPNLGEIESTNPCVTEDTWVMTESGACKVKELLGKQFVALVDGQRHRSGEEGFFQTGIKPVYRLKTKEGFELRLTLEHLLLKVNKQTRKNMKIEWSKLENFTPGDKLLLNKHRCVEWEGKYDFKKGYLLGLLLGDGTVKEDKAVLSSWGTNQGAESIRECVLDSLAEFKHRKDFSGWTYIKSRNEYRLSLSAFSKFVSDVGIKPKSKKITEEMEQGSFQFYKGLLRGLFDADGTVLGNQEKGVSIRLAQSDQNLLLTVQRMLLRLGIYSKIYTFRREAGMKLLPDGKGGLKEYRIKAQHELIITGENLDEFHNRIGFADEEKQNRLKRCLDKYKRSLNKERFIATVESIDFDGMEVVYDVKIPGKNAFDANGFVAHNCGEQPLLPYESCNLGSINLGKMLKEVNSKYEIDWERLRHITRLSTRFLDDVIECNRFPIAQIKENSTKTRKVGLGLMGWATMLGFLGIAYDSDEAIDLAKKVMGFIRTHALEESVQLAKERGVFPAWKDSIWDKQNVRIRNATLTTIAPTGTISIIAGPTSSGIEPNFSLCYVRTCLDGEKLIEADLAFESVAKKEGFYSKELMERIAKGESIQAMAEVPEEIKRVFKTAMEISPYWHIKMQAAFQAFTDNAVSKTINLPNSAVIDDVKEAYLLSYKLGCKGITVYRDGSREVQVLNVEKKKEKPNKLEIQDAAKAMISYPKPRSEVIVGTTTKVTTGCGNLYVTINQDEDGNFFEVFTQMGKAGGCAASQLEAVGRLVSLSLRGGIDIKVIVEQLKGIRCPSPSWAKGEKIFSCADAIARVLEKRVIDQKKAVHLKAGVKAEKDELAVAKTQKSFSLGTKEMNNIVGVCIDCGFALRHQEGCMVCDACGYSKC